MNPITKAIQGRDGQIYAMVEEMVRDFTTAHPKTKSEVRRRILEAIEEAEKRGEEREKENKLILMAEQQLLGFYHRDRGYSLSSLVDSMGLTKDEYSKMEDICDMTFYPEEYKQEIIANL